MRCPSGVCLAYVGALSHRYSTMQLLMSWGWRPRVDGHADVLCVPSWDERVCGGFMSEGGHAACLGDPLGPQNHSSGALEQELWRQSCV